MTIAYSATVFQQRTGQDHGEFPLYFSRALAAINENLENPQKRATDTMIATVSVFSNMEVSFLFLFVECVYIGEVVLIECSKW